MAPWGSVCAQREEMFCSAFCRAWPSGNCCTQATAEGRSFWDQEEASWLMKLFFAWPDGRLAASSAAAWGLAEANWYDRFWSALFCAVPDGSVFTQARAPSRSWFPHWLATWLMA